MCEWWKRGNQGNRSWSSLIHLDGERGHRLGQVPQLYQNQEFIEKQYFLRKPIFSQDDIATEGAKEAYNDQDFVLLGIHAGVPTSGILNLQAIFILHLKK